MDDSTLTGTKACTLCNEAKTLDDFHRCKSGKDGRASRCKTCIAEYKREHYRRNSGQIKARVSAAYHADPEPKRQKNRDRWTANAVEHGKSRRAAYQANREQIREARREAESDPAYRDRAAARSRLWYEDNRDRAQERNREYNRSNPEVSAGARRRRRALERNAVSERYTREQVWAKTGGVCGVCGGTISDAAWHIDHIVPLSRGGDDTLANTQPTDPRCNRMKSDLLMGELEGRLWASM